MLPHCNAHSTGISAGSAAFQSPHICVCSKCEVTRLSGRVFHGLRKSRTEKRGGKCVLTQSPLAAVRLYAWSTVISAPVQKTAACQRAEMVPAWRIGQKSGRQHGGTFCPLKVLGKVTLSRPTQCPQAEFQGGSAKLKTDSSYF